MRNFEGVITTYPEPENYIPGRADEYFHEVYPHVGSAKSDIGVSGLLNDQAFNLVPEGLLFRTHKLVSSGFFAKIGKSMLLQFNY